MASAANVPPPVDKIDPTTETVEGEDLDGEFSDDLEGSIDSALEYELELGIPQPDEPFIQKYLAGRDALIAQEKKQRHGTFTSSLLALF